MALTFESDNLVLSSKIPVLDLPTSRACMCELVIEFPGFEKSDHLDVVSDV